jgi:hypothetical protein
VLDLAEFGDSLDSESFRPDSRGYEAIRYPVNPALSTSPGHDPSEGETDMSKVFSAHAVSVDGYISGRTPAGDEEFGRGLGDAPMLFDWTPTGTRRAMCSTDSGSASPAPGSSSPRDTRGGGFGGAHHI